MPCSSRPSRFIASRRTEMTPLGGKIACVSSWDAKDRQAYTFRRSSGIDPDLLSELTDRFGTIDRPGAAAQGCEILPGPAWIEQDVDVLIPAALENQITAANAARIHRRVLAIVEAANGPMTAEANEVLENRGVLIIPDIIANAGGVTCSYFEQVQGHTNYYWSREEVLHKLDTRMSAAFHEVHERANTEGVSLRDAAHLIAIDRVARACRTRGWV